MKDVLKAGDVYSRALKRQGASEELWFKFYNTSKLQSKQSFLELRGPAGSIFIVSVLSDNTPGVKNDLNSIVRKSNMFESPGCGYQHEWVQACLGGYLHGWVQACLATLGDELRRFGVWVCCVMNATRTIHHHLFVRVPAHKFVCAQFLGCVSTRSCSLYRLAAGPAEGAGAALLVTLMA
uniref:Uncharacterized protein n=1 Tax=Timema genevievae TaxID=629358 RepID=A0A7R9PNC1_TIMGE|nr:unnamed protein product [Timema genevievae]